MDKKILGKTCGRDTEKRDPLYLYRNGGQYDVRLIGYHLGGIDTLIMKNYIDMGPVSISKTIAFASPPQVFGYMNSDGGVLFNIPEQLSGKNVRTTIYSMDGVPVTKYPSQKLPHYLSYNALLDG